MTAKTDMLPDFVFNHLTRLARIGSQIVCDAENVVQTVDGGREPVYHADLPGLLRHRRGAPGVRLPPLPHDPQPRLTQIIRPIDGITQCSNGYGNLFITVTIPVARVVIEDDSTGPVNHARPRFTVRP